MNCLTKLFVGCLVAAAMFGSPDRCSLAHAQAPDTGKKEAPIPPPAENGLRKAIEAHSTWAGIAAALLVVGIGVLLYFAARPAAQPFILKLGPSFFFWLGIVYLALLLLIAAIFSASFTSCLIAGVLPGGVPWFGALGAVTISLEGVFLWNAQWNNKFNYWHIGRPLFGAVLGIVAFFIFILTISASGTTPKFLQGGPPPQASDVIVYYVVAFLVGYREETFRDLIKRATDMILKPGTPTESPAIMVKNAQGVVQTAIDFGAVPVGSSRMTLKIENTGNATLQEPVALVTTSQPPGQSAFRIDNNHLATGGDLGRGDSRTIDVVLEVQRAGESYTGTLTIKGKNLAAPQTIPLTGRGA